jgi:hypothetical protein
MRCCRLLSSGTPAPGAMQAPYRAESRHHEQESAKSLARALDPARDDPPDEVAFSQERDSRKCSRSQPRQFRPEIGGWLSHRAIVAREYNVAMIVGTRGLSRVTDGSLL